MRTSSRLGWLRLAVAETAECCGSKLSHSWCNDLGSHLASSWRQVSAASLAFEDFNLSEEAPSPSLASLSEPDRPPSALASLPSAARKKGMHGAEFPCSRAQSIIRLCLPSSWLQCM